MLAADARGGSSTRVPSARLHFDPIETREGDRAVSFTPRRLGAYTLIEKAGSGGMSTVYLAERDDESFERRVAIKVILAHLDSEVLRQRFQVERQVLAQLEHPNIARLYDSGTDDDGSPFLVMEYIEGEPIDAYCEAHDPPLEERLRLFRQVCEAVAYAHRNLVVHRDIKPANILVAGDGEPKLLDFGIAKLLPEEGSDLTVTQVGQRALTPSSASPEQLQGRPMTTASDIFSLGAVLYQLLTGELREQRRSPTVCRTFWTRRNRVLPAVWEVPGLPACGGISTRSSSRRCGSIPRTATSPYRRSSRTSIATPVAGRWRRAAAAPPIDWPSSSAAAAGRWRQACCWRWRPPPWCGTRSTSRSG